MQTATYTRLTGNDPVKRVYSKDGLSVETEGSLMVWWIPQVPMQPFLFPVDTPQMAKEVLKCLAFYDLFQFDNNIKPDYANAGGLLVFEEDPEDDGWCEWSNPETGDTIDQVQFISLDD